MENKNIHFEININHNATEKYMPLGTADLWVQLSMTKIIVSETI
jgi:hypothetical protein